MKDLIWSIVALIVMGLYAVLICWLVIEKRKNRHLRKIERARGLLRLADKPYMLPKQQDHEIEIIRKPVEPVVPRCEYVSRRHHVDN